MKQYQYPHFFICYRNIGYLESHTVDKRKIRKVQIVWMLLFRELKPFLYMLVFFRYRLVISMRIVDRKQGMKQCPGQQ
ncbi:hypothetical protein D3C80_1905580 [compost metagenome]